jgi:hypothetical protein
VIVDGRRINSCLTLAVMHEGDSITTIEGLGTPENMHPVQSSDCLKISAAHARKHRKFRGAQPISAAPGHAEVMWDYPKSPTHQSAARSVLRTSAPIRKPPSDVALLVTVTVAERVPFDVNNSRSSDRNKGKG